MLRSARTTAPATGLPPVPAVHAQLCAVIALVKGARIRMEAGPRSQVTPKVYGSSAAVRPYDVNRSAVQSLALRMAGEPESRGPMMSLRCCRLAISSE